MGGRVAVLTGAAAAAAEAAGERFVLEFQVAGGAWQREPLASCGGARFEEAVPVRPFRFEKGLRSFAGWWYFATTETHVGFESWLERDHLMLMDFDPDVLAVSSQPFWLRWRDGDGRSRRHVPDFFACKAGGGGLVVDVRPEVNEETGLLVERIGPPGRSPGRGLAPHCSAGPASRAVIGPSSR